MLLSHLDRQAIKELTAKMMLEVGILQIRTDVPFEFTSGWRSPVYIDCRRLISYPRIRRTLTDFATSVIVSEIGFESLDAIAGGETAGIPFAAWIADRLMMPMQYVRKKPKSFGVQARVEGDVRVGTRILLVEDLTTDGRSKIFFCKALRDAQAIVEHTLVLFFYDIFQDTLERLQKSHLELHSLATGWDLLRIARQTKYCTTKELDEVELFFHNPQLWSEAHGGISEFPPE